MLPYIHYIMASVLLHTFFLLFLFESRSTSLIEPASSDDDTSLIQLHGNFCRREQRYQRPKRDPKMVEDRLALSHCVGELKFCSYQTCEEYKYLRYLLLSSFTMLPSTIWNEYFSHLILPLRSIFIFQTDSIYKFIAESGTRKHMSGKFVEEKVCDMFSDLIKSEGHAMTDEIMEGFLEFITKWFTAVFEYENVEFRDKQKYIEPALTMIASSLLQEKRICFTIPFPEKLKLEGVEQPIQADQSDSSFVEGNFCGEEKIRKPVRDPQIVEERRQLSHYVSELKYCSSYNYDKYIYLRNLLLSSHDMLPSQIWTAYFQHLILPLRSVFVFRRDRIYDLIAETNARAHMDGRFVERVIVGGFTDLVHLHMNGFAMTPELMDGFLDFVTHWLSTIFQHENVIFHQQQRYFHDAISMLVDQLKSGRRDCLGLKLPEKLSLRAGTSFLQVIAFGREKHKEHIPNCMVNFVTKNILDRLEENTSSEFPDKFRLEEQDTSFIQGSFCGVDRTKDLKRNIDVDYVRTELSIYFNQLQYCCSIIFSRCHFVGTLLASSYHMLPDEIFVVFFNHLLLALKEIFQRDWVYKFIHESNMTQFIDGKFAEGLMTRFALQMNHFGLVVTQQNLHGFVQFCTAWLKEIQCGDLEFFKHFFNQSTLVTESIITIISALSQGQRQCFGVPFPNQFRLTNRQGISFLQTSVNPNPCDEDDDERGDKLIANYDREVARGTIQQRCLTWKCSPDLEDKYKSFQMLSTNTCKTLPTFLHIMVQYLSQNNLYNINLDVINDKVRLFLTSEQPFASPTILYLRLHLTRQNYYRSRACRKIIAKVLHLTDGWYELASNLIQFVENATDSYGCSDVADEKSCEKVYESAVLWYDMVFTHLNGESCGNTCFLLLLSEPVNFIRYIENTWIGRRFPNHLKRCSSKAGAWQPEPFVENFGMQCVFWVSLAVLFPICGLGVIINCKASVLSMLFMHVLVFAKARQPMVTAYALMGFMVSIMWVMFCPIKERAGTSFLQLKPTSYILPQIHMQNHGNVTFEIDDASYYTEETFAEKGQETDLVKNELQQLQHDISWRCSSALETKYKSLNTTTMSCKNIPLPLQIVLDNLYYNFDKIRHDIKWDQVRYLIEDPDAPIISQTLRHVLHGKSNDNDMQYNQMVRTRALIGKRKKQILDRLLHLVDGDVAFAREIDIYFARRRLHLIHWEYISSQSGDGDACILLDLFVSNVTNGNMNRYFLVNVLKCMFQDFNLLVRYLRCSNCGFHFPASFAEFRPDSAIQLEESLAANFRRMFTLLLIITSCTGFYWSVWLLGCILHRYMLFWRGTAGTSFLQLKSLIRLRDIDQREEEHIIPDQNHKSLRHVMTKRCSSSLEQKYKSLHFLFFVCKNLPEYLQPVLDNIYYNIDQIRWDIVNDPVRILVEDSCAVMISQRLSSFAEQHWIKLVRRCPMKSRVVDTLMTACGNDVYFAQAIGSYFDFVLGGDLLCPRQRTCHVECTPLCEHMTVRACLWVQLVVNNVKNGRLDAGTIWKLLHHGKWLRGWDGVLGYLVATKFGTKFPKFLKKYSPHSKDMSKPSVMPIPSICAVCASAYFALTTTFCILDLMLMVLFVHMIYLLIVPNIEQDFADDFLSYSLDNPSHDDEYEYTGFTQMQELPELQNTISNRCSHDLYQKYNSLNNTLMVCKHIPEAFQIMLENLYYKTDLILTDIMYDPVRHMVEDMHAPLISTRLSNITDRVPAYMANIYIPCGKPLCTSTKCLMDKLLTLTDHDLAFAKAVGNYLDNKFVQDMDFKK